MRERLTIYRRGSGIGLANRTIRSSLRFTTPSGSRVTHFASDPHGVPIAWCGTLTIHHGRHTFISHAPAGGRTLAKVRDAVGHANISIASAYLYVAVEDDGVGRSFG